MTQNEEISMKETIKKIAVKGMYGFQTILNLGLGMRLGIYDYLFEKARSSSSGEKITSVSFTLEELSENLKLDLIYLDAWLHVGIECGIFEIDDSCERCAKTAANIFELLVDRDNMFYFGSTVKMFYKFAPYQDYFFEHFKTGKIENILETPSEDYKEGQEVSAAVGKINERLFTKYCRNDRKKIQQQGAIILEVGCGYGYNLEIWANKYKKAKFIGIDIDPNGVAHARDLVKQNNWSDRIEIFEMPLEEYIKTSDLKFDMVLLNEVLHEMNPDEKYRISVFENIYSLLKDDCILFVSESMIPDTFDTEKKEFQLFNVMHKSLEVAFGSRFYNEETFKNLVDLTPFEVENAEFIRERGNSFWKIRK